MPHVLFLQNDKKAAYAVHFDAQCESLALRQVLFMDPRDQFSLKRDIKAVLFCENRLIVMTSSTDR